MSTLKKRESNRRNAKKSTGPRSAAGKVVASRNALKHGLLSRHLIVEGESREEFSELLRLLSDEFQPVGLVEHALVERIGIAFWRQRRLVRAESAEVSINQQRFGDDQKREVRHVLDLDYDTAEAIEAPDDEAEDIEVADVGDLRDRWKALVDEEIAETDDPFAHIPEEMRIEILREFEVEASQVNSFIKKKFGSWAHLFEIYVDHYESLIQDQRIREVSRLILQSQALPSKTDLLARYQTALDNELYKALKALREAQAWRQARATISVAPMLPGGDDTANDGDP